MVKTRKLDNIAILGLGLLGGSLGLAIGRTWPGVRRLGYSHRAVTRKKALQACAVDAVYETVAEAVRHAQLVVLASPIGTFEDLLKEMAPALPPGCVVTDVGSTKVLPVRWAEKYLPANVEFLGSHPMAGSEQRGVDFARDDLFNGANCILTPTPDTPGDVVRYLKNFWKSLGMRVGQMSPAEHDRVIGSISHLPHALAVALVNVSEPDQMLLCGRGFLDTTRIASGPPGVWHDILLANAGNMETAIVGLIKELQQIKKALHQNNSKAITKMLTDAQAKRNSLVKKKLQRRELPE